MNVFNGLSVRVGNASGFVPTTALFVNSSANVGIGTSSPDRKLTIQRSGTTSNTELSFKDQAGNTQATF